MDKDDRGYYGWIPILTKHLLFDYFIKELEKERRMVKVVEESGG